ncbi:hypothetical protein BKA93DRAFT_471383 [Sparassis latifolia]
MPVQKRVPCQVCSKQESKYTCAQCFISYCSLPCYKEHKGTTCAPRELETGGPSAHSSAQPLQKEDEADDAAPPQEPSLTTQPSLRPLTSLRWPYVEEESAYPDPLKRDDPKSLQLHQYEEIATSPAIRRALASHPQLPELLRSLDQVRGADREEALQRALGVGDPSNRTSEGRSEEDIRALRELAEAVEAAVRSGKPDVLGLDWGDDN